MVEPSSTVLTAEPSQDSADLTTTGLLNTPQLQTLPVADAPQPTQHSIPLNNQIDQRSSELPDVPSPDRDLGLLTQQLNQNRFHSLESRVNALEARTSALETENLKLRIEVRRLKK